VTYKALCLFLFLEEFYFSLTGSPNAKEFSQCTFISGAPSLVRLSVESTEVVGDYAPLAELPHLCSLNLSRCPAPSRESLEVLGRCGSLEMLFLSGMEIEGCHLERLSGMW
jgi:hypothetical protein